jgi:hypothetical protein
MVARLRRVSPQVPWSLLPIRNRNSFVLEALLYGNTPSERNTPTMDNENKGGQGDPQKPGQQQQGGERQDQQRQDQQRPGQQGGQGGQGGQQNPNR